MANGLNPNVRLPTYDSLVSQNGQYSLVLRADGDLVLIGAGNQTLWATGTQDQGVTHAVMQGDGNLALCGPRGVIWSTDIDQSPGSRLVVRDDGYVAIIDTNRRLIWSSEPSLRTPSSPDSLATASPPSVPEDNPVEPVKKQEKQGADEQNDLAPDTNEATVTVRDTAGRIDCDFEIDDLNRTTPQHVIDHMVREGILLGLHGPRPLHYRLCTAPDATTRLEANLPLARQGIHAGAVLLLVRNRFEPGIYTVAHRLSSELPMSSEQGIDILIQDTTGVLSIPRHIARPGLVTPTSIIGDLLAEGVLAERGTDGVPIEYWLLGPGARLHPYQSLATQGIVTGVVVRVHRPIHTHYYHQSDFFVTVRGLADQREVDVSISSPAHFSPEGLINHLLDEE